VAKQAPLLSLFSPPLTLSLLQRGGGIFQWSSSHSVKIFSCRPSLFAILKFLLATIKVGSAILLFAALGLNGTTLRGAPFNTLATFYLGVRT
jgi:hypothetical protein